MFVSLSSSSFSLGISDVRPTTELMQCVCVLLNVRFPTAMRYRHCRAGSHWSVARVGGHAVQWKHRLLHLTNLCRQLSAREVPVRYIGGGGRANSITKDIHPDFSWWVIKPSRAEEAPSSVARKFDDQHGWLMREENDKVHSTNSESANTTSDLSIHGERRNNSRDSAQKSAPHTPLEQFNRQFVQSGLAVCLSDYTPTLAD
ncbi:DNA repair protein, SNF2 family [Echinococcus multilocularis]|uniref:DNA repair protein, SNF2 family n=1 Tax=Echinococcus multilocularis TaxID=6211 RepID=A0A0S4MQ69_ECHMU|nr:DNA repair protein, SNF2 family [Echinococcus multilocularis]